MLTYWFKGLPNPYESKAFEIDVFGYDVDKVTRILNQQIREDLITQRILRRLAADAVIHIIMHN